MQIILEPADLKRLSAAAREEVLRLVRGEEAPAPTSRPNKKGFRWRAPYDLTPELARKLIRGIGDESRRRLAFFARDGGRATMQELLAVTKDTDLHALSGFEGTLTRKLRRLVGDDEKIVSLIMWDYDSERWDSSHTRLLDGTYYVSAATSKALRTVLGG